MNPQRPPIGFSGLPTQAPLNRQEQKSAFEALKQQYFQEPTPTPYLGFHPLKETKLSESEALKTLAAQMEERNLRADQIQQVEKKVEEIQMTETVKQFYCRHTFNPVKAKFMGLPVRYKVCTKCGLVK